MIDQREPDDCVAPEPVRAPTKYERMLTLLLNAHEMGRGVTHDDALRAFGESCFPTTASQLRAKGLSIDGEWHEFDNRDGGKVRRKVYRLQEESVPKARKLRNKYRKARGVAND